MSKDIRSFFLPKGKNSNKKTEEKISDVKKNKKRIILDSDSDEEKSVSPKRPKKSKSVSQKPDANKSQEVLKPVNVLDVFGKEKVKRTAPPAASASKSALSVESIHDDDDFEAVLCQIDKLEEAAYHEEECKQSSKTSPDKNANQTRTESKKNKEGKSLDEDHQLKKHAVEELSNAEKESPRKKGTEYSKIKPPLGKQNDSLSTVENPSNAKQNDFESKKEKSPGKTPSNVKQNEFESKKKKSPEKTEARESKTSHKGTPPKGKLDLDSSVTSPADPLEKRRQHAVSYIKYLQREGPKYLGSKEIPKGKPGCFSGLVFVITGVLDSLEREEAVKLIEQYGGKVTLSVSRNTSYVVYGKEPGPSKMAKAEALGRPLINEDGLLNLITLKSEENGLPENHRADGKKIKLKRSADSDSEKTSKKLKHENKLKSRKEEGDICKTEGVKKKDESSVVKPVVSEAKARSKNADRGRSNESVVSSSSSESVKSELSPKKSLLRDPQSSSIQSGNSSLWVDKYKPTKTKQIIGQQGDRSSMKKLMCWLENWHKNHSGNKVLSRPSPWAKNDDGAFFKAALLSGPPGIGKTTMAHLVSRELGFDVVEYNASDTRSKKLLHLEIAELLSNKSLFGYFHGSENTQPSAKHVLIMDEVDGMAGNEDRGGVQELIQLIKNTHIPIICMCNDRNHPKIRSLANYCFDLRVTKPRLEQIRGAMMSVCFKEGLKISAEALAEIIIGANMDMRQILHHLSMWSAKEKSLSTEEAKKEADKAQKDMKMGPWDVVKKVFSAEDHKTMSIHDKSDLFFHDYNISPLFVQENYLSVIPVAAKGNTAKTLQCVAHAAESISMGDITEKYIRSKGAWNLLPVQAVFASVIPGDAMEGYFKSQINFPLWLGKNSRTGKLDRLLQELHVHTRLSTSGGKEALNLEYLTHMRDAILQPLIEKGSEGVPASLEFMQRYSLLREDLESILELTQWPNQKDPMASIESKVKAALTRAYNKEGILTPYSVVSVVKKGRGKGPQDEDYENDDADEEEEDQDDVSVDAMIKAKKPSKKEPETKAGRGRGKASGEPSSRGTRGRGRGRGKQ